MYIKDLVSIVVPTYNRKAVLREMIESVIVQTYRHWELIIVDDGSDDGTDSMVSDFVDDRIRYYKRPENLRKGAQCCRNYGKGKARGEYLVFFDSDDLIVDTCLEKRVAYMKKANTDYCIFPIGTFTTEPSLYKKTHLGVSSGVDILTSFLNNYYQHAVVTNIYRKEAIKDLWWDENLRNYDDFDFSLQCIFSGLSFSFSGDAFPDYLYRVNWSCDTISSTDVTDEKFSSAIYLFNKVLDRLSSCSDSRGYRKDFIQYHLWYYALITREGSRAQEVVFLSHVKSAYGEGTCARFRMLRPLFSGIPHKQARRFTIMLMYYILFRPSRIGDLYKILRGRVQLHRK